MSTAPEGFDPELDLRPDEQRAAANGMKKPWPRAVDIEIYEDPPIGRKWPNAVDWAPTQPNRIRINGVECLTPENAPVIIEGLLDSSSGRRAETTTATVTLFLRSLKAFSGEVGEYPQDDNPADKPRAADLECYEPPLNPSWIPSKPWHVRLNGVDCLTDQEPIKIGGLGTPFDCMTATITFKVRSLKVHGGEPEGDK